MSESVRDVDIKEIIPINYKTNLKFEYDGCEFISLKSKKEGKYIELEISSWTGISAGAIHFYGKLKLPWISAKCLSNESNSVYWKVGRTSSGSVTNEIEGITTIEITRPVSARDKKMDRGKRFEVYELGEPTNRFETEKELIEKAKKEFKRIFAKGWTLYKEKYIKISKIDEQEFYKVIKQTLVGPNDR